MLEEKLERSVEQSAAALTAMADDFFDHPEVGLQEFHAFETLTGWLEKEGFTVERGIAGMDTAFRAVWKHGEGGPNIGLLCEYDALAGLGHACGHHMQGPAILGAAKALKDAAIDAPYTITVYGTPAEESISGKVVMLENGCTFEELDVALMMHGGPATQVDVKSLALNKLKIIYHGVCSHAALKPEKGRSALDAMELMNVGTNFLREHMIDAARIHYAIIDGGGISPNVVQPHALVLYLIRAPRTEQAQELYRRVNLIAQGMAMATETKVHWELIKTCAELIPNLPLEQQLAQSFAEIQAPEVTDEELAFLRSITASSTSPKSELLQKALDRLERPENRAAVEQRLAEDFHGQPLPYEPKLVPPVEGGSTDVGDVSWQCPTAQIHTATWAPSSGGHTWQIVAQGKSTVAHKYMCYCGKVLGQTAIRLLQQPQTLAQARAAWEKELTGRSYLPIPPEVKPRAISSL